MRSCGGCSRKVAVYGEGRAGSPCTPFTKPAFISFTDSAKAAAAGPARKTPSSSRSRQQLQRERLLQLSVQKSTQAGTAALPAEQKLQQPPPKEEVQPAAGSGPSAAAAPAVRPDGPHKAAAIQPHDENHHVTAEEETPAVKELEQQEAEVLVRLFVPAPT